MVVHPGERVDVTPAGQSGRGGGGGGVNLHISPVVQAGTVIGNPEELVQTMVSQIQARHPDLIAALQLVTLHG